MTASEPRPTEMCLLCDGKGFVGGNPYPCSRCNGTGSIETGPLPEEPPAGLVNAKLAVPTELKGSMAELEHAAVLNSRSPITMATELEAARAALVALYERQSEALVMFREEQSRDKPRIASLESQLAEVRAINKGAAKLHLDQYREIERLKAEQTTERAIHAFEVERLKADRISPEEALALLSYTPNEHSTYQRTDGASLRMGIALLRRLSQSATEELKE